MLTPTQIAHFWNDGFLVFDDVFSQAEIDALSEACSAPEENVWKVSKDTIHSLSLTHRHPAFLELARDPRIVDRLLPLLGPDIQLQHSKLAAKPVTRNAGPFGWHQDFSYFPHTNSSLIALMIMLDDSTPDNGCMSMVRGSHKMGLLNHARDGYFTGHCQQNEVWEDHPEKVVPITPRAGGISIHHCLTLHGSPANLSGRPRRGIVFQYRAADSYQMADAIFPDTGIQISGERSESVRCETATWRLPKVRGRPGHGFGEAYRQEGDFAKQVNGEDAT